MSLRADVGFPADGGRAGCAGMLREVNPVAAVRSRTCV